MSPAGRGPRRALGAIGLDLANFIVVGWKDIELQRQLAVDLLLQLLIGNEQLLSVGKVVSRIVLQRRKKRLQLVLEAKLRLDLLPLRTDPRHPLQAELVDLLSRQLSRALSAAETVAGISAMAPQ